MERKRLAVVLLLLGKYASQVGQLDKAIKELKKLPKDDIQIILSADSNMWMAAPQLQMLVRLDKDIHFCCSPESDAVPAITMNRGMEHVNADYVQFALLADPFAKRARAFLREIEQGDDEGVFYFQPDVSGTGECPAAINTFGWCQTTNIGIGLGSLCVPMNLLRQIGQIDENPILGPEIERWYALAVSKEANMRAIGEESRQAARLYEYPMSTRRYSPAMYDLSVRYAVYTNGIAAKKRPYSQCASDFWNDLNDTDRDIYEQVTGFVPHAQQNTLLAKRYKILIVGGYWEYHHNQICFFNYLERLYGQGFATYRPVLEHIMTSDMVEGNDLVIFTRCRSKRMLEAIEMCEKLGIPTLYMIDDNWLTIAEDHPDQGGIFVPGNEQFDNFIDAIGSCTAVWLFSDLLKKDIMPYTRCVQQFTISVDPKVFEAEKKRERNDNEIVVGFAGSLRWDDAAFRALARYARRHRNIKVVLYGGLSSEQEMLFRGINTIREPFESYAQYAKHIAEIQPDLLLAPIPHTHTAQSKCYNKYIESGIIGAACIYSACKPYTDVIHDEVNGYLVKEESEDGWYTALSNVLSDPEKLREVQKNAYLEVNKNYTVDALLSQFVCKLTTVIEEKLVDD